MLRFILNSFDRIENLLVLKVIPLQADVLRHRASHSAMVLISLYATVAPFFNSQLL